MSSLALSPVVAATTSASSTSRVVNRGRYARLGLATVIAAVVANILVYFLGDVTVGYDPDFLILANPSGVAIFTFVAAAVAVLVYGGLLRSTRNPVRIFNVVSAVVFVVTTIPDFTYVPSLDGASNGQTGVLVLSHVVAAAVIVKMLTTRARPHVG